MTSVTSRPWPPVRKSLPPRPRTSSAPSSPASLSGLSVPSSKPPLGQPGRSFVVRTPRVGFLKVRVPSHRASSDAVAGGERVGSFLVASVCPWPSCGASELVPAQPTIRRRTAHPIRKVPTTTMRCPWRTATHPPSLCLYSLLLASRSMPHNEPWRISTGAYSPKCVEGVFSEVELPCNGV